VISRKSIVISRQGANALRGLLAAVVLSAGCSREQAPVSRPPERPSILLVTLDTTRADAIGPDAKGIQTPAFNALAARGRRFRQAYATVPETLPSHTSLMTGLYPAGHGIHENGRYLPSSTPVIAERLHQVGYRTSAFVSAFVLAKRFGLGRGFDVYDDTFPRGRSERMASETTDLVLRYLATDHTDQLAADHTDHSEQRTPTFMWVHYYDPHAPYTPPEPYKTTYARDPYRGEVAYMDSQLGRLVLAFERHAKPPIAIIVVGDHGEGLGDHGEPQHGDLLYQSTMLVPLVIVGPGVSTSVDDAPVSARRVYHTILDWAGLGNEHTLRASGASQPRERSESATRRASEGVGESEGRSPSDDDDAAVMGEAMKPFLEYGWPPQTMGVSGRTKAIVAGKLEAYDVIADPAEAHDLGGGATLPSGMRKALDDYPVPTPGVARAPENLDPDAQRRLSSLGYVSATAAPIVRKDAPRPADMTRLFPLMEQASALFTAGQYRTVIPLLERIHAADAHNMDALLRLATAYSMLGQDARAERTFKEAAALAPGSEDVKTYLALHYARGRNWSDAVPLLEQVVAADPGRRTAVEALARLKARQGTQAMDKGDTPSAIVAFERSRTLDPAHFQNDLDLGALYLDARRFDAARDALDRALASHPDDPMALFKRAQVAVLLKEPDARARIDAAKKGADAITRPLIEREKLFR
jgi:arylsulfatase A-like enzyme/tetratricopeptide (TPR) repeat protein